MKIPKKLKIGGHTVTVDISHVLPGLNGESITRTNTINICKTITQSQKESTLIHEIIHFLNVTLDDSTLGHALLDSFAEQLYQVLSDNKLI